MNSNTYIYGTPSLNKRVIKVLDEIGDAFGKWECYGEELELLEKLRELLAEKIKDFSGAAG